MGRGKPTELAGRHDCRTSSRRAQNRKGRHDRASDQVINSVNWDQANEPTHHGRSADTGHYPTQQAGLSALAVAPAGTQNWNGPYLKNKDSLIDPWGNPYQYKFPGSHGDYDLYSFGADGREGGDGENSDITSWQQ